MKKILSLNLVNTQLKNLNPSTYPILFYWNQDHTIEEELLNNEDFKDFINKEILNVENYSYTKIYIVGYDIETEEYNQKTIDIQYLYNMNDLDLVILSQQYILEIFKNLHRISIKSEYSINNDDISIIDDIIKIYTILKNKFDKRISPETVKQYLISQLEQEFKLSDQNIQYIINTYNQIIN